MFGLFFFIFEDDFGLHGSETENHKETDAQTDVEEDYLELEPLLQLGEVLGHIGNVLVDKPGQVNDQSSAREVVHLQEQAEGALLPLEVDSVELNQLVKGGERVVDEQEPVNEVVRLQVLRKRVVAVVLRQQGLQTASVCRQGAG